MTRFALIPFAIFASACADSADLEQNVDEVEAEVRELLESHDGYTARDNPSSKIGQKVVQLANLRFAEKLNNLGCNMVGAGFGVYGADNSRDFTGAMFHNSTQLMARVHGEVDFTGNRHGMILGESTRSTSSKSALLIDADWKGGKVIGDMYSANGSSQSTDLTMMGSIHRTSWTEGHFIVALAQCD